MFNFNTTKRRSEADMLPTDGEMSNGGLKNMNQAANVQGGQEPYSMADSTGRANGIPNADVNARIEELNAQCREFMQKNPDFDMKTELQNPKFVEYVFKNGISVEDAYILVHLDEIIKNAVSSSMNRAAVRRNRIFENGTGKNSPAVVKKNPKDMSDKEIDAIIERVRNGEKISF